MIDLTKLLPIGDKILLELLPARTISEGGIHVPQNNERPCHDARVLAKGPHAKIDAEPGDQVIFDLHCFALDVEADKYRLVPSEAVLAILSPA